MIAPFSPDQVRWINAYQDSGAFHPLTCLKPHRDRNLIAQTDGLICPNHPQCDYIQTWVPDFACDPRWEQRVAKTKDTE